MASTTSLVDQIANQPPDRLQRMLARLQQPIYADAGPGTIGTIRLWVVMALAVATAVVIYLAWPRKHKREKFRRPKKKTFL